MICSREHILCVEDEVELLEDLACELREQGYRVSEAGDGEEALALIEAGGVDLIISDMHLPRLNGLELMKRVHEAHGPLPFILMSAHIGLAAGRDSRLTDCHDILVKPIDYGRLARVLAELFHRDDGEDSIIL